MWGEIHGVEDVRNGVEQSSEFFKDRFPALFLQPIDNIGQTDNVILANNLTASFET